MLLRGASCQKGNRMRQHSRPLTFVHRLLQSCGVSAEPDRRRKSPPRRLRRLESLEGRRLLAIGALDPSFSSDGKATYAFDLGGSNQDIASATAVDQNGKIVVVGAVQRNGTGNFDFAAVRYNSNGSIDSSFGSTGRAIIPFDLGGGTDADATAVT